jgi:MFS family permease
VAFLLGFGMYASFILVPQLVETPARIGYGFGASVTGAGLFLVPSTIAMLVVGTQTGLLEKRFGSKPPLLAGALVYTASYLVLAFVRSHGYTVAFAWCAAALVLGVVLGLAIPSRQEEERPEAAAVATSRG